MNGKVNTLFMGYNKELLSKDSIVLECEKELTNSERQILEIIFDEIKKSNLQSKNIKFSLDDYKEEDLINLQNKKVMILNLDKKEYVLTQWYTMVFHKGSKEVLLQVDNTVFEYLTLFVLNEK